MDALNIILYSRRNIMRINNNLMAMNTHRQLGINANAGAKAIEKLSSGYRINRAGDDAAGLAISEKMRGQIRGLNQASRNAQDGISLIQTAEGALNESHAILQRMRELAVQSASDTNTNTDRGKLQDEIDELKLEVTRIAETTQFNTQVMLDGTFGTQLNATSGLAVGSNGVTAIEISGADASETYTIAVGDGGAGTVDLTDSSGNVQQLSLADSTAGTLNFDQLGVSIAVNDTWTAAGLVAANNGGGGAGTVITTAAAGVKFHIGANTGENLSLSIGDMTASGLAIDAVDVTTQANADAAITTVNAALDTVSNQRASLGAKQNRLEHTIKNLDTSSENLQASESRIRDVDMAKEMMNFTKNNILQQAAQSMLAQANQAPQGVLQLLR
jgi:flagellin